MSKKKKAKPGITERARRKVASDTTGETGFGTTTKRGFAMLGAMIGEAFAPSKNVPSRASIKAEHERKVSEKKKAAMKGSEGRRRAVEGATGTSGITNPLRKIGALADTKKKKNG